MAEPTTYNLPRGCTAYQCQAIRRNPSGLLGRFGLSGQPQNTWQNYGRDFERVEDEWKDRGIDDTGALCCPSRRLLSILTHLTLLTAAAGCCCSAACGAMPYLAARKSEAVLGGLSTFNTWYNKGSAQQHSDFKATVCQRVYTTFKLRQPASWWLDVSCGGGSRQMVAATCGLKALGLDLRSDCIQECAAIARRLQRRGAFATGGRAEFRQSFKAGRQQITKQEQHACIECLATRQEQHAAAGSVGTVNQHFGGKGCPASAYYCSVCAAKPGASRESCAIHHCDANGRKRKRSGKNGQGDPYASCWANHCHRLHNTSLVPEGQRARNKGSASY